MVSLTYLTRASVKSKEVEEVAAIQSDFWRSVVKGWLDFDKRSRKEDPESDNDTRNQQLLNNTQVRYNSKPLLIKKMDQSWTHICVTHSIWQYMEKHTRN